MTRLIPLIALPILFTVGCGGADASVPAENESDVASTTPPSNREEERSASPSTPSEQAPLVVHSLANLGDSISQGFDADDSRPLDLSLVQDSPASVFKDNPVFSWVQGSDARVGSVAAHFKGLDSTLVVTPLSRSGAELVGRDSGLPNLEKQARQLAEKNVQPDLVMVLLGGNDVCNRPRSTTGDATAHMYSVDEWRAAAVKGLDALAEVAPAGATVRVVSMPRVDLLYETALLTSIPVTYRTPLGRVSAESTCQALWNVTAELKDGICKIVTTESDESKRRQIGIRIDEYNEALATEVRSIAKDTARNPKKIRFQSDWHGPLGGSGVQNESGGTFMYEPKHVSKLDCFHPSIEGQKQLAELVLVKAKWE